MSDSHPVGSDFSSDAIQCTIDNQTSGTIQYNTSSMTGGHLTIDSDSIGAGSSVQAFSAQGPTGWPSGCGGEVVFNLPNGKDKLVVIYNVSVGGNEAITFAQLQNQDGSAVGCDSYFATVDPASVNGTSLTPTVTVYDTGATATGKTGCVNGPYLQITLINQLSTWITLNNFPNPMYTGYPVVTDGTTSVAPGGTAIVLCSFDDSELTLVYNITNDYLLTIQQNKEDLPTAGFNVSCPYSASVSQGSVPGVDWAYIVTVSAT
jgi:hypothetical protein